MNTKEISIDNIKENGVVKASEDAPTPEHLEKGEEPQPPMPDFPTFGNVMDCDTFLEELHKVKNIFDKDAIKLYPQLAWQATLNKLVQMKDAITNLWKQLKSIVGEIVQEIVDLYKDVIAFFDCELKKIKSLFKKYKKATTEKEKEEKLKELKKFGKNVLEILGIVEIYYALLSLWKVMKNMWGVAKDGWQKMITNFKSLKDVLSDCDTPLGAKIVNWINTLLPIIAALALTVLAAIDMCKENQKANEKNLEEGLKDIEKPIDVTDLSILLKKAKEKKEDDNKEEQKDSSIISICPVETPNEEVAPEEQFRYAIEVALNYNNFSFIKNINDDIKLNDVIGYIEGIPIKSKIEGKVIEKKDRHIIIKPNEITSDVSINIEEDNRVDKLIEAYENITKIETILKDDILYTYRPFYTYNANFIDSSLLTLEEVERILNNETTTVDSLYNEMLDEYQKVTKKMENDIENISSKSNIEKKLNKENGLLEIKDDIMDVKEKYFSYIFSTINNNDKNFDTYKEVNYKLCDFYLWLMSGFDYDKDNQYKVELLEIINSFIKERKVRESFERGNIIVKINNIAEEIDGKKNFFKNKLEKNLSSLNLNNIDETHKYLNKIFSIKGVESSSTTLDTNNMNSDNINSMMNSNESSLSANDKKNIEKDKKSKKIAVLLYLWKECENTIKSEKTLKEQVLYEYNTLKAFYNKLKNDYEENKKITNDTSSFAEINWPTNGIIYINNIEHKHYLFINDANGNDNISEDDGNNQLSTKTKYEPTTYMYWLKYCGVASMINCMLPQFWGTGLIVAGAPMMMPIILIPTYVFGKNTIHVLGIGICGLAIYPMLIISNMTGDVYSYLPVINIVLELTREMVNNIKQQTNSQLKLVSQSQIDKYDKLIKETEEEIEKVKKEINVLKNL